MGCDIALRCVNRVDDHERKLSFFISKALSFFSPKRESRNEEKRTEEEQEERKREEKRKGERARGKRKGKKTRETSKREEKE